MEVHRGSTLCQTENAEVQYLEECREVHRDSTCQAESAEVVLRVYGSS